MQRHQTHASHYSERFFSDRYLEDTRGAQVELAFEEVSGLPMDRRLLVSGDGGIDFHGLFHGKPVTIDVKGFVKPKHLAVKVEIMENSKSADIFVLAGVLGDKVSFLGWATREMVRSARIFDLGYGLMSYNLPAASLYPMEELVDHLSPTTPR